MNDARFPKFQAFYDSLVRSAASRGITRTDAEDLAGDAIERGLAGFDPAKGEFPAFCHTILANLMKNYWRDKKKTEPYAEEDGPPDPGSNISPMELAEAMGEIRSALGRIKAKLSSEENLFLEHLQDVLDESGPRAISEAARRSGLKPAKGWDLFRKIQRKVNSRPAPLRSTGTTADRTESPQFDVHLDSLVESVGTPGAMYSIHIRTSFDRFTSEQLKKIESLLP